MPSQKHRPSWVAKDTSRSAAAGAATKGGPAAEERVYTRGLLLKCFGKDASAGVSITPTTTASESEVAMLSSPPLLLPPSVVPVEAPDALAGAPSATATATSETGAEAAARRSRKRSGRTKGKAERASSAAKDSGMPSAGRTMMLRNIPSQYTREKFLAHLESLGFNDTYDFLYLPIDFSSDRNLGYAFVNFRTREASVRFEELFHDVAVSSCMPGFESNKVCKVQEAFVQGWQANYDKLRGRGSTKMMLSGPEHWQPIFLDAEGNRVHLLAPKAMSAGADEFVPGAQIASGEDVNWEAMGTMEECYDEQAMAMQWMHEGMIAQATLQQLAAIKQQIEFYLSPENLEGDEYLRSLKNAEGWYSLWDIVQFPRLRKSGIDTGTAVLALVDSVAVETSPDGAQIRPWADATAAAENA